MAYIAPDTKVWLCKDVPLNASYDDTILFKTKEDQISYFLSKAVFKPTNFSVLKERQGVLRMSGSVGNYYNINYMIFTNSNFSDKYFYAFVTSIEYINPNLTLIYFTLDKLQTWLFDFKIEKSMVEREHVLDDGLFKNLEEEGIEVQERLAYQENYFDQYIGQKMIVLGTTVSIESYLPGGYVSFNLDLERFSNYLRVNPVIIEKVDFSYDYVFYTEDGKALFDESEQPIFIKNGFLYISNFIKSCNINFIVSHTATTGSTTPIEHTNRYRVYTSAEIIDKDLKLEIYDRDVLESGDEGNA